jgi:hypothetical protein
MNFKQIIPHLIALALMLAVSMVYYAPNAFSGKVLPQPDNEKAFGMRSEIMQYQEAEGKTPLWTNGPFGGMPSYQIYAEAKNNFAYKASQLLILFQGYTDYWAFYFCAMLTMYLLLLALRIDWRIALMGGIISAVTVYNADIVEAGHSTKMFALALAPGVFAGAVWLLRGQMLLGGGFLALFAGMQIAANHVQITYYTFLLLGIYFLIAGVRAAMRKTLVPFLSSVVIAAAATALAVGSNAAQLWSTWEYGKETIRGKSELKQSADKGDGLSKDYLFGWSYGVGESMTLLVPHFAGGGAGERFDKTQFSKRIQPMIVGQMARGGAATPEMRENADRQVASLFYAGSQPFVGTSIYFGIVLMFLAMAGMLLSKGTEKWWLLTGALFMLTIAWGKNFFLNDIWYDVMPMFKKFRAVSMALGLSNICFAALAALGLQELMDGDRAVAERRKALFISGGVTLLLLMLAMAIAPKSGANDGALGDQKALIDLLQADRKALVRGDVMRSLMFLAAAFAVLFFYLRGSLKAVFGVAILGALALADQWGVASRTLNAEKYVARPKTEYTKPEMTAADKQIKEDKDIHYRVLDMSRGSLTGNATTSFFHKSLSGYHAAKIQIYQEVVDKYLGNDLGKNMHIVGMLNGKYLIGQDGQVMPNDKRCGDAWFVNEVQTVGTADEELSALGTLDPKTKAVVQSKYAAAIGDLSASVPDSLDKIELTGYHPEKMEYTYSSNSDRFAVFSEVFYAPSKGWKTYLNGQPYQDFVKTNYLVRGLRLPKGQQMKLEMRFEPTSWNQGETISLIASILSILFCIAGALMYFRKERFSTLESISDVAPETVTEARNAPATPKTTKTNTTGKR